MWGGSIQGTGRVRLSMIHVEDWYSTGYMGRGQVSMAHHGIVSLRHIDDNILTLTCDDKEKECGVMPA